MLCRLGALGELHRFVSSRLADRLQLAVDGADGLDYGFTRTSQEFVADLGRDIVDRPWAHAEIGAFLVHSARRYRRHPDYNEAWDSAGAPR